MAKQPPKRPEKGQPIPHNWFQDMYDYIRSLEVRGDLQTTTVSRDRSGTVVRAPFATSDRGGSGGRTAPIVAKITLDNEDGSYHAEEVRVSTAAASNFDAPTYPYVFDSGNAGVLWELNRRAGVPIDTHVIVHRLPDSTTGESGWYFVAPQANLFPVDLTQTGGSAGNATTACSFTYTVTVGSATLGTAKSPTFARPAKGKLVAATKGTAYYDTNAALVLYQADEVPDVQAC